MPHFFGLSGTSAENITMLRSPNASAAWHAAAAKLKKSLDSNVGSGIAADFRRIWLTSLLSCACYLNDLRHGMLQQDAR
jgi:hypothetical protein